MLKSKRELAQVEGYHEIRKYLLTGAPYADLVAAGGLFPLVCRCAGTYQKSRIWAMDTLSDLDIMKTTLF